MTAAKPKPVTPPYMVPYQDRQLRTLITPEGVDLKVRLADSGLRIGAFTIDIIIMIVSLIVMSYILGLIYDDNTSDIVIIVWLLGFFFLRSFYFMAFEMGAKAATPGKRLLKIRVAARHQAKLTANAVFTRNALREIEFFLPLTFLGANIATVDGWISLFGLIWCMIFLFFPLFNKDRLRAGDILAGTWVVQAPRPILSQELSETTLTSSDQFAFKPEQLNVYGIHELHILEDVIRLNDRNTVQDVAQRIRQKINWQPSINEADIDFLKHYYTALRGRLESRLLFGKRKKNKFDD